MTVAIEMVSDPVCPWCWLGLRRIQTAIAQTPDIKVQLLFRPYDLDPTIPAAGVDYKEYMGSRVSSPEGKERMAAVSAPREPSVKIFTRSITRRDSMPDASTSPSVLKRPSDVFSRLSWRKGESPWTPPPASGAM